jgi:hypothetical protein
MARSIKTTLSLKCEDANGPLIDVKELVQYFDTPEAQVAYLQAITDTLKQFGNEDQVTNWAEKYKAVESTRAR